MKITEAVLIFLIAELIAGIAIIWKFASAWGGLKQADKDNHDDINAIGKRMRQTDKLTWQRIDAIENFLSNRGYNPPSLNIFEDDK